MSDGERVGRRLVSCQANSINGNHDFYRVTACLEPGLIQCDLTRPCLHHSREPRIFQRAPEGTYYQQVRRSCTKSWEVIDGPGCRSIRFIIPEYEDEEEFDDDYSGYYYYDDQDDDQDDQECSDIVLDVLSIQCVNNGEK